MDQPERDEDLLDVRRVLAGDLAGFEGIVQRWQTPLLNLAYRFVRDRARAEDLAQEAFLKAFQQLSRFRGESAFSTWLFSVALNVYRSALRRQPMVSVSLDSLAERIDPARPVEAALTEGERDELVRRAVAALPPRYRDPLIVYYFNDRDLTETARILAVPEGTVKAWLHRGRNLLRTTLGAAPPAPTAARKVRKVTS